MDSEPSKSFTLHYFMEIINDRGSSSSFHATAIIRMHCTYDVEVKQLSLSYPLKVSQRIIFAFDTKFMSST